MHDHGWFGSVGYCIAVACVITHRSWSWRLVVLALVAFHVVQTCLYLPAWASDETLFERGLATHPLSLKALHNVSYFLRDGTKAQVSGCSALPPFPCGSHDFRLVWQSVHALWWWWWW